MATDNTTQESRTERIQILTLHPRMEPRVFDCVRERMWEDVIENGATLSQNSPFVWYLVVDIPQDEIYAQPLEFQERQYNIWRRPREQGYIGIWELHELLECKFCGNLGRQENSDYCGTECHTRDKQGERL